MPGPDAPRRQLHGYVSKEARDGWHRFAKANRTNVTALLEAFGLRLAALSKDDEPVPELVQQLVQESLGIAGSRSTRGHDT